jgi:hypothetical protein
MKTLSELIPNYQNIVDTNNTIPTITLPCVVHLTTTGYRPAEQTDSGFINTESSKVINFAVKQRLIIKTIGVRLNHNPSTAYTVFATPHEVAEVKGRGPQTGGGYWNRARYSVSGNTFVKTSTEQWVPPTFDPKDRAGNEVVVTFPFWNKGNELPNDNLMAEEPLRANWVPPVFTEAVLSPCPPLHYCTWHYNDVEYNWKNAFTDTSAPELVDPNLRVTSSIEINGVEASSPWIIFNQDKQVVDVHIKHAWFDTSGIGDRSAYVYPGDLDDSQMTGGMTNETQVATPISGSATYTTSWYHSAMLQVPSGGGSTGVSISVLSVDGPVQGPLSYGVTLRYDATQAYADNPHLE